MRIVIPPGRHFGICKALREIVGRTRNIQLLKATGNDLNSPKGSPGEGRYWLQRNPAERTALDCEEHLPAGREERRDHPLEKYIYSHSKSSWCGLLCLRIFCFIIFFWGNKTAKHVNRIERIASYNTQHIMYLLLYTSLPTVDHPLSKGGI